MSSLPQVVEGVKPTTAGLYEAFLSKRKAESKFEAKEIRLSEVGLCPRRQTLRMLGYEADESSLQQESIFYSGEEHEDTIYFLWASRYPRRVIRQQEVRWWGGKGHIDIWVSPIKHIVESKSVKAAAKPYLPQEHHVAQVLMYLHFWGRHHGATAEIAYRIKETGEILSYPVEYLPAKAMALEAVLADIAEAVGQGKAIDVPANYRPSRFPCSWRTDEGFTRCAYFKHCWPVEREETVKAKHVITVTSLADEVAKYLEVVREYGEAKERLEKLEAIKKHHEAAFGTWLDERGADGLTAGNGVTVFRTSVKPWVSWDVKKAIEDGVINEEALAPYRQEKGGGARWTVKVEKGGTAA